MIVAETESGYQFVTQPDHAALAGQFADRWGTDAFDRPEPFAPVVLAAYAHDTGWGDYDRRPHLDDAGKPVDFRDMPAETWIELYDAGVDAVGETDAYAGLLVSMHGAGLRNQRYGLSPEWPETPERFEAFVAREQRRQTRLLAGLLDGDRRSRLADGDALATDDDRDLLASLHESKTVPDGYDGRLWADYRRLQVWDELSLALCITDDPPGYESVDGVPTTGPRADTTVSVERVGDGAFALEPYPFDTAPLEVAVPCRTVDADAVADESSLARAYYEAPRETRTFTLRRGGE